jgi:hypothetical protein
MNSYQREQLDALTQVVKHLEILSSIRDDLSAYLAYRRQMDEFSERHFTAFCTPKCFESRASACCSKDGIITFWADVVVNVANADRKQIDDLFSTITTPLFANKCIYLGENGCRWAIRPLGCALFLCDPVQEAVLVRHARLRRQWEVFESTAKAFRWPDRPVLFDHLEQVFIEAGCRSSLMYINTTPGLLRVRQQANTGPPMQKQHKIVSIPKLANRPSADRR